MPGNFIDTNVLVYVASGDPIKAERAEALIRDGGVISVPVLNELTNVARRKMRMSWPEIRAFLSTFRALLTVEAITIETHETGLALAERYNLSTDDAMIAAAALLADCDIVWSQDMQDGLRIGDGLRVINPFRVIS
jgi:predicted nucleic acid-binding protein